MYYIYILQSSKDGSYYTGLTCDLRKQLKKHNEGGQKYTSQKLPYLLRWYGAFSENQLQLHLKNI